MDNKIKYAIALLVFCPLIFMILACGAAVGSISILAGAVLTTDYDIHETDLYEKVEELTAEYMEGITEKIHDKAEQIREAHMDYVEQEDGTYKWECTVDVHETTYRINTTCFYAYISTTNMDLLSGSLQNYLPTKEELAGIYDRITKIVVEESDDGEDFYVYNKVASSREMKEIFFPGDEIQQSFYQTSFDNFYSMIGDDLDYADGFLGEEELEEVAANNMGIPLYLQYQAPWGSQAYGHGTIATSGCGPTCHQLSDKIYGFAVRCRKLGWQSLLCCRVRVVMGDLPGCGAALGTTVYQHIKNVCNGGCGTFRRASGNSQHGARDFY